MKIKEIVQQSIWQKFFDEAGSPSFLQSWEWGSMQKSLNYEVLRLGVYSKHNLKAIAQIIKLKSRRGNFLFIPHGPIFGQAKNLKIKIKSYIEKIKNYLMTIAKKENFSFIRIAPILENTGECRKIFRDLGFITAPIYMHAETVWTLPLNKSEEELLSNMRKTTRYLIKKAVRDGVVIETRTDKKAVDDFYKIYEETAKRENFIPFSKKFIKKEFEIFHKAGNALFLFGNLTQSSAGFNAEQHKNIERAKTPVLSLFKEPDDSGADIPFKTGNRGLKSYKNFNSSPIASALIIFTKSTAFYHQGASFHSKIPATYLLQWEAIRKAKQRGCQSYNFWGIYDEHSKRMPKSWLGLTLFKTGFGGQKIDYLATQDYIISPKYYLTYLYEKFLSWRRGV